jgi:teichuronic acid biosynthesis glycosyltransferase TuaH
LKDKMIYVMNVDWNWIKQRPHFLAQGLAELFDIAVLYQYRYGRKGLQKREPGSLNIKPIYVIPRIDRYKVLSKLNNWIKCRKISSLIKKNKPRYIFLTFPDQYRSIPKNYDGIVIYDCMDNHLAFIKNAQRRELLEKQELALLERANIVLASSDKLKSVLVNRYGVKQQKKIQVVRNGYSGSILEHNQNIKKQSSEKYTICYFGTISSWFNFNFIEKSLLDFKNIQYVLIGPLDGVNVPKSDRIQYIGTVEHDRLFETTKNTDCFIMPFVVNEIIESVDPVKLYEYINFNKNIICVEYDEVMRFGEFVHFYSDYDSFKQQLQILMQEGQVKYSLDTRTSFLKTNSWRERVDQIRNILSEYTE